MTPQHARTEGSRVPNLADEKLRAVTRRAPLTVPPGTSLRTCLERLQAAGTGDSVFVTEGDHLLGVLPERDIFAKLTMTDADLDQPVESSMSEHPWTLHLDRPIRHAIDLMQTGRYRNVPLIDDAGNLVGVVRPTDILKYLAEAFPQTLLNLPPRPNQQIKESEGA